MMQSSPPADSSVFRFEYLEIDTAALVRLVLALNIADALFTATWVMAGRAEEANPLMDQLMQISPGLFVFGKLALAVFGLALLWRHRTRWTAVSALVLLFIVYYTVFLIHLQGR